MDKIDKKPTPEWWIYQGSGKQNDNIENLPSPPPWRIKQAADQKTAQKNTYIPEENEIEVINAALYLRRPILVTGKPGTGKSSLASAVAHELKLGDVFRWSITTQTLLSDGLYQYDAIGRLQENKAEGSDNIHNYLSLGALGSAFAASNDKPRVLLIDEIDKSDIDLPNNLLHIFEESEFEIPELLRHKDNQHKIRLHSSDDTIEINNGKVICQQFTLVIMTSNGEREFPPAFLRRCLQLEITLPSAEKLADIIESHLGSMDKEKLNRLIENFLKRRNNKQELATDQLLNAVHLTLQKVDVSSADNEALLDNLWSSLSSEF